MSGHGVFFWNELLSEKVDAARQFYEATLGWTFDEMEMPNGGTYLVAMSEGKPVGGIIPMDSSMPGGDTSRWFAYIAVDDIDARLAGVEANGGKVTNPPFDVPGVGRIAIIEDPSGAPVGWMTPAESET